MVSGPAGYSDEAIQVAADELFEDVIPLIESHLVTEDEADQLKTLDKVKHELQRLANKEDLTEEKEKYRLMQGILYFRTQSEYIPRLWQAKRDLIELDRALAKARKSKRGLVKVANAAPRYFKGYDEKINADKQRIHSLLGRLDSAIHQQESYIQKMAMQSLIQRRQQLENYHVRARFGIARLYDSLVIEKDKKKTDKAEDGHDQK